MGTIEGMDLNGILFVDMVNQTCTDFMWIIWKWVEFNVGLGWNMYVAFPNFHYGFGIGLILKV